MKIGDTLTVEIIYHKDIGGPESHPDRPGVARAEDGTLYVLDRLDTTKFKETV